MTVAHEPAAKAAPSVLQQVVRATLGTVAVLLAAALAWGAVASADRLQLLWFRVAGDPSVRLADGITLPSAPETVEVPRLTGVTWTTAEAAARIRAVTGGPVHPITLAAARTALGDQSFAVGAEDTLILQTSLGLVTVSSVDTGSGSAAYGLVSILRPPSHKGPALSAAEQQDLLRRLVLAWGAGHASTVPGVDVVVEKVTPARLIGARLKLGDVVTDPGSAGWAQFDDAGRLTFARIPLQVVSGALQREVVSPASAFDAIRHHAEGTAQPEMPVTTWRIEAEETMQADGPALFWELSGTGTPVGQGISVGVAPAS